MPLCEYTNKDIAYNYLRPSNGDASSRGGLFVGMPLTIVYVPMAFLPAITFTFAKEVGGTSTSKHDTKQSICKQSGCSMVLCV